MVIKYQNIPSTYKDIDLSKSWIKSFPLIIPSLQWLGFHIYSCEYPKFDCTVHKVDDQVDIIISWIAISNNTLDLDFYQRDPYCNDEYTKYDKICS